MIVTADDRYMIVITRADTTGFTVQ